jgi:hypothetical protein
MIKICKVMILPSVLYGCLTWSLILRVEHRINVFERRVTRRMFGSNREELVAGRREFHIKELHNLYYSLNVIRMRMARYPGHTARMEEAECLQNFGNKAKGKGITRNN